MSKNPMKVVTGANTRWSYANVWEPKSINGGTPKYSISLIICNTSISVSRIYQITVTSVLRNLTPNSITCIRTHIIWSCIEGAVMNLFLTECTVGRESVTGLRTSV